MIRKIGILGILVILIIPVIATTIMAQENETEEFETNWKVIIAIGRINVCFEDKIISGFAIIGYTAGEILVLERINIKFDGIPLFINNGLMFSFCFYKSADTI